jgi:prephenate dehydratase
MSSEPEAQGTGATIPAGQARVGYLGPEGTFTEEALLTSAREDAVEPVGLPTIYDVVMALCRGELEWAVVPIENSLEGSINVTLDLLAGEAESVEIVGETLLRIRHSLIGAEMLALEDIETVLTHPQVPGQCTRFLRGELAHARVLAASSTAEAVRMVSAATTPGQAALGTTLAARIYGATVIRDSVEDRDDNETRFAWLGPRGTGGDPPLREHAAVEWKTSLVFWGLGAERPGWLLRCLQEFAGRNLNLTKIESRPLREGMGNYMFFVDLNGGIGEESVREAIAGLRALCQEVRVLGSYPAAEALRV